MKTISEKEKRQHSTLLVPYSYYQCAIPEHFKYVPLHWHNEFEINYISDGTGSFRCGDTVFTAGKGDIILIPPDMPHSITQEGDHAFYYNTLVFSKSLLQDSSGSRAAIELIKPFTDGRLKPPVRITRNCCRYEEIKTVTKSILSCSEKDCAKYDLLMKSELLRLLWLLADSGKLKSSVSETAGYSQEIARAVDFILENFSENITIEQLAISAHLSKSCFMGRFKREVGQSAVAYINSIRIKKACEILISTSKSASAAAFESGFRNISNFNRQFLRHVGCSPTEYRKTVRVHLRM